MKLANYVNIRLSIVFSSVLFIWSIAYCIIQMYEIHDGIDEGLSNLRQEFVVKANSDSLFIDKMQQYNPLNIIVSQISKEEAEHFYEYYSNTKIYFPTEEEYEEVRMLNTVFLCDLDDQYYSLKIFTSTVESEDLIKNIVYMLIALWISLAICLIYASKRIIKNTNRPFYDLLNNLKKFQLDNREIIVFTPTKIDEYKELNKSIKQLLEDNIKIFSEQKNFIENASHELQTPLAIVINKLELLMNDDTLTQKQVEDIYSALDSLNRMKRLNSNLLLLSKIKNKQYPSSEPINFIKLFNKCIDSFESLIEYKNIKVTTTEEGNPSKNMNLDLAHIMAINLIKNAIAHNVPDGTIHITYTDQSITIANDGNKPQDITNIFDRYVSFSDPKHSSGLGLSIVKSITELYDIKIEYRYETQHIITLKI